MSELKGLLPELKGQLLEISLGGEYEELNTADSTRKVNGVVYGVLKNIVDDFLVLDSYHLTKDGKMSGGNIIYINTWAIQMFTVVNSSGSLNDVMLSSAHTRKIKYLLGLK
jgi:hypothetical protein